MPMLTSSRFDGLFCQSAGTGALFMAMSGGMGLDQSYLTAALSFVADEMRLLTYDHRGNGHSDQPLEWTSVTPRTWVEDADNLRAHLGAESMVLFGHSFGGLLAQAYALQFPERLTGLILCSTYSDFKHAATAMANAIARGTPAQLAALSAGFSAPCPDDQTMAAVCREIFPLYFHDPAPEYLHALGSIQFRAAAFNHTFFSCLPTLSTADRLGDIRVPTLVIAGDDDWIAPSTPCAATLHQSIPGADLAIIPRAGHFPFIERPTDFRNAVTAWLATRLGMKRRQSPANHLSEP